MATKEQLAGGIVQLKSQLDAALESGDASTAQSLESNIRTLVSAYQQTPAEDVTASPETVKDSVDSQGQATELLNDGAYKVDQPNFDTAGEFASDSLTSGERLEIERPRFLTLLSDATEIPEEQIDITSGLPGLKRLRMGTLRDESQVFNYLADEYGQDGGDVRRIAVDSGTEFLVQHPVKTNGQYVLADEYGPSLKDILDISREAVVTSAEVGATLVGPGKTSVMYSALKAGLGTALANLGIDTAIGDPNADEDTFGQNVGNALTEGGKATLFDLGLGLGVKGAARYLGDGQLGISEQADKFQESRKKLEERFNMQFPETFATRSGTLEALEQQEEIISKYPEGLLAGLAKKAERARDIIYDLSKRLTELPSKDFGTLYRSFRNNQIERTQKTVLEIAQNDKQMGQAIDGAINDRMERLGALGATSSSETASIIRNAFESSYRAVKAESDNRYEQVFDLAEELGVTLNPGAVSREIENVINSLDLPKDVRGEVLNIFKPKGLNKVSRQAGALGKETTEELPTIYGPRGEIAAGGQTSEPAVQRLSLRQLDTWRKEVSDVIGRQIKQGKDTSGLKDVQASIEGMIDKAMAKGGDDLVQASSNAKLFFTESVVPFRAKGIADISKRGKNQEYTMGAAALENKFFTGSRAVENIQELKRVIGSNAPALANMRAAYLNNLMDKAMRYDGSVDYLKLSQVAYNKDIVRELYGAQAVKGFDELDRLMKLNKGSEISQDLVDSMTKVKSPADIEKILELASEQIRKRNFLERNAQKLIGKINKGELSMENPVDLISAVRKLKAGEVRDFINALPATGGIRQSFRQEYINDLMTNAGRGTSANQTTSRLTGGRDIWDHKLMSNILRDKTLRANYEAVLGKNTVRDIEHLNNVLKGYSRKKAAKSKLLGTLRGSTGGSGKTGVISSAVYGSFDYVRLRVLSAAFASGNISRVLNKSRSEDELFRKLLPTMLATTGGIEALTYEADKDPRFQKFLFDFISNSFESAGKLLNNKK